MTRTLFVMALLIAIAQIGYAQATELGTLYLSGKVVNENKRGMETEIYVYRNGKRSDAFKTSRIGRFEFGIPLQDSVAFVVIAEEYVSKTVFVDARVPENDEDKDYRFPFFIDLFPVGNIPSNIDLKRPVGKIIDQCNLIRGPFPGKPYQIISRLH